MGAKLGNRQEELSHRQTGSAVRRGNANLGRAGKTHSTTLRRVRPARVHFGAQLCRGKVSRALPNLLMKASPAVPLFWIKNSSSLIKGRHYEMKPTAGFLKEEAVV